MGLDMYLYKRHYIGNKWRKERKQTLVRVVVPKDQEGVTFPTQKINNERISEITEEVAYWRKANHIHQWFVENCQDGEDDCRDAYVSREQLQELLDLCKRVKAASKLVEGKIANGYDFKDGKKVPIMVDGKYIEDPTVAKELLPTQEGFFFGGTDYDEYYLQDIEDTISMLEPVLAEDGDSFEYHSSW